MLKIKYISSVALFTLFSVSTATVVSCKSSHKTAKNKKTDLINECEVLWQSYPDQPQLHWHEIPAKFITERYKKNPLPKKFTAYNIDRNSIKEIFEQANSGKNVVMIVPVPGSCEIFELKSAGVMPEALQKKYPNLIALKGYGKNNKAAEIRTEWNGDVLKAQIIYNGSTYLVTPTSPNGLEQEYLYYNQNDAPETKQPFELPNKETAPVPVYDK
jgi:hypothetical protein